MNNIKLVECPRDAMQGWKNIISTDDKVLYINALLEVGFHTIDFGSFVSPKAIPQMADTKLVLPRLHLHRSSSKLLAIVANLRGAMDAVSYEQLSYLGYPFSVSETFQKKNTNASMEEAFKEVCAIQNESSKKNKELVIYISMAFGNPYGDLYHEDLVLQWSERMVDAGIKTISLADTVGLATPIQIAHLTKKTISAFPSIDIGVHLHSTPQLWKEKISAALENGCLRYDGAIKGIGGCPLAGNALVGNIDTELMLHNFIEKKYTFSINQTSMQNAIKIANQIFV